MNVAPFFFYTADIFFPFIFQNLVYQWNTLSKNSIRGSSHSKPVMLYFTENSALVGTHNAYLNVTKKGGREP